MSERARVLTSPDPASPHARVSIRKRGRPTPAETARITKLIIAAATDIFLLHSFEEASVEAIAARAGVKKDTIYKRFSDKRMLLWAVLQEKIREWKVAYQLVGDGKNLEDSLKHYAVALMGHATSDEGRKWIRHVESAWPGLDKLETRRKAMGYDRAERVISREIRRRTEEEGRPAQNPDLVAAALMALLAGWTDTRGLSSDVSEEDVERFAHAAVDLIIGGRSAW